MTNKEKLISFCSNPPELKFLIENSKENFLQGCEINLKEANENTNNFKGCPDTFGLVLNSRCIHSQSKNKKGRTTKTCAGCWEKALGEDK